MYRIIDTRGTGKTSRLMLIAKENNAVFVCKNPQAMKSKSYSYGIVGIDFVSYEDFLDYQVQGQKIVIDELEDFIKFALNGVELIGYSLSKDN